jgi:UrcA family protein
MKTLLVVFTALLTNALATVACATPAAMPTQTREISFADLNLNHSAGAKRLYFRIKVAARGMCGESNWLVPARLDESRRCVADVISRAVKEVDSPLLTRYHVTRVGAG